MASQLAVALNLLEEPLPILDLSIISCFESFFASTLEHVAEEFSLKRTQQLSATFVAALVPNV